MQNNQNNKSHNTNIKIYNKSVTISGEDRDRIMSNLNNFVEEMKKDNQSSEYYIKKRKASKPEHDITIGKLGEAIAALALGVQQPLDMEIRKDRSKGWLPDLQGKIQHVKTCDANTWRICKDFSWTFQYSNDNKKGGRDPLFRGSGEELIAFVNIESIDPVNGTLMFVAPWSIVSKLLKDPVLPKYKDIKKCLYFRDVITYPGNEFEII